MQDWHALAVVYCCIRFLPAVEKTFSEKDYVEPYNFPDLSGIKFDM